MWNWHPLNGTIYVKVNRICREEASPPMTPGVGRVGINRATRRDRWCCLFTTDFDLEKTASKKTRGMQWGTKASGKSKQPKMEAVLNGVKGENGWETIKNTLNNGKAQFPKKVWKCLLWICNTHTYTAAVVEQHSGRAGSPTSKNDTRFRVLNTWTGTLPLSSFPTTVGENPMRTRNKGFMCFGTWTPKKAWIVASKTVGNRHGFTMFWEWWYFEVWQGPKNEIANHLSHLNRTLCLMQIHIGKSTHFATCVFFVKLKWENPVRFPGKFWWFVFEMKSVALSEKSRWKRTRQRLIQSDLTWSVPWICEVLTNKRLERGYPPGTCPTSIKLGTFPHVGYFLFRRWVTSQNRFSQNVNMSWCSFLKATTKSPNPEKFEPY